MTTREISLPSGHAALIDEDDWEIVSPYRWRVLRTGSAAYVQSQVGKRSLFMHRLIMAAPDRLEVDHVNHDGLDNRRSNLRLCTRSENAANKKIPENNTSGYKGVSWCAWRGKWRAQIYANLVSRHLGYFDSAADAGQAYNAAAVEFFGEFACLNEGVSSEPISQSFAVRRDNKSGYRGVSFHKKTGKWSANVSIGGRQIYLGLFTDPREASQVVNAAYVNERRDGEML
jgi:hypothetical protein